MTNTDKGLSDGSISSANAASMARLRESLGADQRKRFNANERQLASHAADHSSDEFRKTLRDWAHLNSGDDGVSNTERRYSRRRLTISDVGNGMGALRAELDPESLETVRRAITDIANEMRHGTYSAHLKGATHISNNQRLMANALVELYRRASSVDAKGGRRSRPTVIVTVAVESLIGDLEGSGIQARLADGTPIPAEIARRLACDANLLPVALGGAGQPLDVGRSRRLATEAQRAALRTLYPECAGHGCERPFDWCDIHHIKPWQNRGSTDLDNLVPLCSHHHHLVHEGGWSFSRQPDQSVKFHKLTESGSPQRHRRSPEPSADLRKPTLL